MQLMPMRGTPPSPLSALTLDELRRIIPSSPHRKTVENWCDRGVKGHQLKHEWHGGRRFTCLRWYEEFSKAIAEARQ